MPLVKVTDRLITIIKDERKKRKIRGDKISTDLGKTTSFISQLENGKIEEIDMDIIYEIFKNIIDKDNLESFMQNLLQDVDIKLTEKELEQEKWLITFNYRYSQIPIPSSLVDYIKIKLDEINKTPSELVEFINRNIDLEDPDKYEINNLIIEDDDTLTIRFEFQNDIIDKIIRNEIKSIPYIYMMGIIYGLLRLQDKNSYDSLEIAKNILNDHKFYTVRERRRNYNNRIKKSFEDNQPIYDYMAFLEDEHQVEYAKSFEIITSRFEFVKDSNILWANLKLKQLIKNMKKDPLFMFLILGMPFSNLNNLDVSIKKEFSNKLKELIDSYSPPSELVLDDSSEQE